MTSGSIVLVAATLLRDHWEELSNEDRVTVLDRLVQRAESLFAGLTELIREGESDQERIADLQTAAGVGSDRIEALEAAALDSEAAALVSDARIVELAAEVERLLAVRDQAAVIDEAKGALMSMMHISEDAAFAVLVAASHRDDLTLYTVARRITASRDEGRTASQ